MTSLAGELFVAAELLKRGLQTSVTFGNAKAIDLLAFNPLTKRSFTVQVKTLRKPNFFPIAHSRVEREHIYVFVLLNELGEQVDYFVVPGAMLADDPNRFTKWFQTRSRTLQTVGTFLSASHRAASLGLTVARLPLFSSFALPFSAVFCLRPDNDD
jgi:hypothetical protein